MDSGKLKKDAIPLIIEKTVTENERGAKRGEGTWTDDWVAPPLPTTPTSLAPLGMRRTERTNHRRGALPETQRRRNMPSAKKRQSWGGGEPRRRRQGAKKKDEDAYEKKFTPAGSPRNATPPLKGTRDAKNCPDAKHLRRTGTPQGEHSTTLQPATRRTYPHSYPKNTHRRQPKEKMGHPPMAIQTLNISKHQN